MRKERKSRAQKAPSNVGRRKSADPRMTCHLMLSRTEREACETVAKKSGLGFSPWARYVLLRVVAEEEQK